MIKIVLPPHTEYTKAHYYHYNPGWFNYQAGILEKLRTLRE